MSSKNTKVENKVTAYTSKGTVEGDTCSCHNISYYSFEHVPYAQVPVGDLRFEVPKDIQTFDDVTHLKLDENNRYGHEDHLFVDIYTPEVRPEESEKDYKRPVIVFVPDSFSHRSAYGAEFLLAEDVALVVLHYRDHIFTNSKNPNGELNIPGHAGFQDVMKGFEFVKAEIRNFGGCPHNITAYGQGMGCAYIRYLTISPFSGQFFHKMILSSSVEHSLKYTFLHRLQYSLGIGAKFTGVDAILDKNKASVEFLCKIDKQELESESSYKDMTDTDRIIVRKNNMLWIEADTYGVRMPVLIGCNSMEGLTELNSSDKIRDPKYHLKCLLWNAQTTPKRNKTDETAVKIIAKYQEELKKNELCSDMYLMEMIESDIKYLIGTIHLATNLADQMDRNKVYLYQFSMDIAKKDTYNRRDDKFYPGASHGDELKFIFNSNLFKESPTDSRDCDYKVAKQMAEIWAKFAESGNPNPAGTNDWQPIGKQLTHYFEFRPHDWTYREFSELEKFRLRLWEEIYGIEFFSKRIKGTRLEDNGDTERGKILEAGVVKKNDSCAEEKKPKPKEESQGSVIVHTSKGPIKGEVCLHNEVYYSSFQHVPYAKVPIGHLRFGAPVNITSFDDLKGLKLKENGRYGKEDHLFLHIYTPQVRPESSETDNKRPVIVFVPGKLSPKAEAYRSEELYGPQFLLEQDVVLVVLSYRRDILGFTAFEEPNYELNVPFDAGILDVIAGFRFVKNEIQHFGGCPDNITAYGHGIGALCVRNIASQIGTDYHLFHKMILSSSAEFTAHIRYHMQRYSVRPLIKDISNGKYFAKDEACIKYLRNLPVDTLLSYDASLSGKNFPNKGFCEDILTELSEESYARTMPVLIGYNSVEGLMDSVILGGGFNMALDYLRKKSGAFSDEFFRLYEIDTTTYYAEDNIILLSDVNYVVGTIGLATHFAREMGAKNVYLYKFGANLEYNLTTRLYGDTDLKCKLQGAAHGDELGYIFKTPITTVVEKDSDTYNTVKKMTQLWGQFAKTGNPNNPDKGKQLPGVVWKPIGHKLTDCLHIDTSYVTYSKLSKMEVKRLEFWEDFADLILFSNPNTEDGKDKKHKRKRK